MFEAGRFVQAIEAAASNRQSPRPSSEILFGAGFNEGLEQGFADAATVTVVSNVDRVLHGESIGSRVRYGPA